MLDNVFGFVVLDPRADHEFVKLFLVHVRKVDERVDYVLFRSVHRVLSAELVELVDVELIVVLEHKRLGEEVLEFRGDEADVLNFSALSSHFGQVDHLVKVLKGHLDNVGEWYEVIILVQIFLVEFVDESFVPIFAVVLTDHLIVASVQDVLDLKLRFAFVFGVVGFDLAFFKVTADHSFLVFYAPHALS